MPQTLLAGFPAARPCPPAVIVARSPQCPPLGQHSPPPMSTSVLRSCIIIYDRWWAQTLTNLIFLFKVAISESGLLDSIDVNAYFT